jgi:hypothetical protein
LILAPIGLGLLRRGQQDIFCREQRTWLVRIREEDGLPRGTWTGRS